MTAESTMPRNSDRNALDAMKKGLRGKCPSCGEGRIFGTFLKVKDSCATCKTELHHQRADDFPPYIVIFIVGHIVVTLLLVTEARTDWSMLTHMAVWGTLTVVLALAMLQPVKGAVVGLQWALRMHGFGNPEEREKDGA